MPNTPEKIIGFRKLKVRRQGASAVLTIPIEFSKEMGFSFESHEVTLTLKKSPFGKAILCIEKFEKELL